MIPGNGPVLRDIHLPPEPGWWPPAPGWWLLALLVIVLIVAVALKLRNMRRRRRRDREIMSEFDLHVQRARGDSARLAQELSQFLRRLAIRENPATAGWQGQRWLAYLDTRSDSQEFAQGIGRVLVEAPYRPDANFDNAALIALVRRWTRDALKGGVLNV